MSRQGLAVVILAAGKGTRMHSDRAKVLHSLASRPLLIHVLDTVAPLNPQRVLVVVGYQAEEVKQACAGTCSSSRGVLRKLAYNAQTREY